MVTCECNLVRKTAATAYFSAVINNTVSKRRWLVSANVIHTNVWFVVNHSLINYLVAFLDRKKRRQLAAAEGCGIVGAAVVCVRVLFWMRWYLKILQQVLSFFTGAQAHHQSQLVTSSLKMKDGYQLSIRIYLALKESP
jgi:hypothetical protein